MKDKYNMSLEENIFVAKRNIIDYIWKSAKLEGLGVTFPETDAIFNGYTPNNAKVSDIIAINNLKHAWQFIFDTLECDTDYALLCQINRIVGGDNLIYNSGYVRKIPVRIGGTSWIPDLPIEVDIKENMNTINKISCITERAIVLMLYCMRAQIFIDGNKRTSMLLANHMMIKHGCGIISIPIENQVEFKTLLISFYETNNMEKLKQYIYDYCIDGMDFQKQRELTNLF